MDNWQKEWLQQLEDTTINVENFFNNVNQVIESFAEEVIDSLEDFSDRFQDMLITDIDRYVEDLVDFVTEIEFEFDYDVWEDIDNFAANGEFVEITTEIPTAEKYPACIGCSNYHGQSYNGQILVCGMHPYGYEDSSCPDWEGFNN